MVCAPSVTLDCYSAGYCMFVETTTKKKKTQTLPEIENSDSRIILESCHFTRIARSKRLVNCCLKTGFGWQFQRHLPLSIHNRIPRTKTKNLRRTRPIMADFVYFSTPEPNLHKLLTIYLWSRVVVKSR